MDKTSIKKKLFGGEMEFIIYNSPGEIAEMIVEEVYEEGLRLQKIFNFYDEESELSLLNKNRENVVSNELLQVLKKAIYFSDINGNYDVSLGKAISARKKGEEVKVSCSYKDILIDGDKVILDNNDVLIDLGSIAKGYIADKLAEFLDSKGVEDFLINARGDIIVKGEVENIIGVQHPRKKEKISEIKLKNNAVATSGDYKQYTNGFDKSHILNQENDISSVTIVTDNLEDADAYATLIFTSKKELRDNIINSNKDIKVLILDENQNMKMYNNFEEVVWRP